MGAVDGDSFFTCSVVCSWRSRILLPAIVFFTSARRPISAWRRRPSDVWFVSVRGVSSPGDGMSSALTLTCTAERKRKPCDHIRTLCTAALLVDGAVELEILDGRQRHRMDDFMQRSFMTLCSAVSAKGFHGCLAHLKDADVGVRTHVARDGLHNRKRSIFIDCVELKEKCLKRGRYWFKRQMNES